MYPISVNILHIVYLSELELFGGQSVIDNFEIVGCSMFSSLEYGKPYERLGKTFTIIISYRFLFDYIKIPALYLLLQ